MARRLEVAFLLPGVMVAEVVAVVGEEADQRVVAVGAGFHGVQYPAQAMVYV